MTNRNQNADSSNETSLNLKSYLALYEGLEISESCSTTSTEEMSETVLIAEWVRPEWSAKPLFKLDYPQMGYVSYAEAPPP
jgi:hypothetical protein